MKKSNSAVWLVGAVVVLLASLGLGLGIKKIRSPRAEVKAKQAAKQIIIAETESESAEPEKEAVEAVVEAVEEENVVVQEPADVEEEEEEEKPEETVEEETDVAVEPETAVGRTQTSGEFGNWRQIWADLNLTEAEQARLRDGFALAMQRWQSMPAEVREVEVERRRAMRARWETMSDEERQEAMGRMRGQFEEWRQSGQVELPQITLD